MDGIEALLSAAQVELSRGNRRSAETLLRRVLIRVPDQVGASLLLATVLARSNRGAAAIRLLERVLSREPSNPDALAWVALLRGISTAEPNPNQTGDAEALEKAERLLAAGDPIFAQRAAQSVLAEGPREEIVLGKCLAAQGRLKEAVAAIRHHDSAEAYALMGLWRQALGDFAEAQANLEESIRREPNLAAPYYFLGQTRRYTRADEPRIRRVEALIESASADRDLLCYAAGKAREDLGQYDIAMAHFDRANAFNPPALPFDAEAFCQGYVRMIGLFPGALRPFGRLDETPVFVVGMVRSGTTLLEQLLSAHAQIAAAGEVPFWFDQANLALDFQNGAIDESALRYLADEYIAILRDISQTALRVVDKMPANASLVGLIHLALPHARFIHIRRSAMDNCLSIYTTRFENPQLYAGDKSAIAQAYRQNARIMDHWGALLPADRFIRVDYEDLVADPTRVAEALVRFLGLDSFAKSTAGERVITTPSLWRVRRPVDRSSVERWRNFEPWIGEFAAAL